MHYMNVKKMRPTTVEKYRAVQARYHELFNVQRLRIDDVMARLSQEFFLCESRLVLILKCELPEPAGVAPAE